MAINATAVLSTDIDSTLVIRKIGEITAKLASIASSKIAPVFDMLDAQQAVDKVYGRLKSIADMVIKPVVDMKSVISVQDTSKAVTAFEGQFKEVLSVAQRLSSEVNNIFYSLEKNVAGGAKGNKSKALAQDMNKIAASTRDARQSIVRDFADIVSQAETLKNVAPDTLKAADAIFNGLKESLANTGGGKVAFRNFFGKVPAADLRAAMQGYKDAIGSASIGLSDILGKSKINTEQSTSVPLANNISKAVESASKMVKPVEIPLFLGTTREGVVSQSIGKLQSSVLSGLDTLSTKTHEWAKIDFVNSFEWGQTTRALTSEAEAAFSTESTGRKIFNAIFSSNKASGFVGYNVGLLTTAVTSVAKKLSVSALSIPELALKGIGKIGGKFWGPIATDLSTSVARTMAPVQGAIIFTFSAIEKIINKHTLSLAASLLGGTMKTFAKIGFGIVSSVYSMGKKVFSALTSFFSSITGFGRGGGADSSLMELSGFKIFSIASVATATRLAANLEEALLRVTTITMQTGAGFKNLQRITIGLSNEFGKSATDIAASLYDIASASFRGSEAFAVLRASLQASTAGMTTVQVASTAISRALRAFNLPVESASVVSDVLFNTVKRGITTFDELAQQITRTLNLSSVTGVSIQELGAVLAFLTRNGMNTEQAIMGVTGLLKSLIAPAKEAKEAAYALGLSWDEASLKQKGFVKLLQESSTRVIANKDVFKKLVGEVYAVSAALSIAQKPSELTEDLVAMNERGAAAESAAQVALGFNYQMEKFWTNFVNIIRNIGQVVLPIVSPLLETVVSLTERIASFANQDFGGFWRVLKSEITGIGTASISVIIDVGRYLAQEFASTITKILPYVGGIINSTARASFSLVVSYFPQILNFIFSQLHTRLKIFWEFLKFVFNSIDIVLEERLGGVYTSIKYVFNLIAEGWSKIGQLISWLIGLFSSEEKIKTETDGVKKYLDEEKKELDKSKFSFVEFKQKFYKDFNAGFDALKFDFKKNDEIGSEVVSSFQNFGTQIISAGNRILKASVIALKEQAEGMRQVLESLELQYQKEITSGQKDRAEVTMKFIQKQKDQMARVAKDMKESELGEALKQQQKLYIDLARARRDGEKGLQLAIIEQIKDNELVLLKLEQQAQKKNTQVVNQQVNLYDSLKNKVLDLIKSGEKLGSGLGNLNQVLDDVFGKNVDRIAKQYGVGQDIADQRELARDVIEARAAGFAIQDVQTIVTRGLMQKSTALTNILTAFQKYQKSLSLEDVAKLGLSGEIVRLLDQAEALGLDAIGRSALLQKSLTEEAFQELDRQLSGDKTVKFVEMANKHFEGIAEERQLQERFNVAQAKVAELTKETVTRNQKLKVLVDELEKKVVELEQMQGKQNQVLIQTP